MTAPFRSLRVRLLLPLVSVALLAAIAVAIFSYWLGDRWARQQIGFRFEEIAGTLSDASFPLNRQVVQLLADLTGSDLVTLAEDGRLIDASIPLDSGQSRAALSEQLAVISAPDRPIEPSRLLRLDGDSYRFAVFRRSRLAQQRDSVERVAVLFDEDALRATRLRAAGLPLATGLSTILLLASVTLYLAGRLVTRIARLQRNVNLIASGDFDARVEVGSGDEVGLLGTAVKQMSSQLKQMWKTLQQQESQRLLHQIAGGLAHQLRNSLTGARMAVELHQQQCAGDHEESLSMALIQLEQTEGYVKRLLMVGSGSQQADRPGQARQCLQDLRAYLDTIARHRGNDLKWDLDPALNAHAVSDLHSLAAAVSNLVLNSMEVAKQVTVSVSLPQNDQICVDVSDDGPGPPTSIADNLFEPFVTSNPEGLGLGLPLVKRSAEHLGGRVEWNRDAHTTHFVLTIPVTSQ